jgi:hypothetical protein
MLLLACVAWLAGGAAAAAPRTVCTVTINSSDERDVFQRHLPAGQYRFVELVQRGQADWLASARRSGVRCDVLVISGHFDDGTEFYTDRHDDREFLTVHEMQRESCSAAGDGLFSRLQEVYLFGCNTLKSEPRHVAGADVLRSLARGGQSPVEAERLAAQFSARYGQSNRDRLRHIFKDVPVLYGFSSKAPLGRTAGPLLERYFRTAPAGEVASGRPSPTLLSLFGPSSMIAVPGLTDADPHAGFRRDLCSLEDDRPGDAHKLAFLHQLLQRDPGELRLLLDPLERYTATLGPAQRQRPEVAAALAVIARDQRARDRFLEFARDADESTVQARMLALARSLGWLSPAQAEAEFLQVIADRLARGRIGHTEVDLVCTTPLQQASAALRPLLANAATAGTSVAQAGAGLPGQPAGTRADPAGADRVQRRRRRRPGSPAPPGAGRHGEPRGDRGHRPHDRRQRAGAGDRSAGQAAAGRRAEPAGDHAAVSTGALARGAARHRRPAAARRHPAAGARRAGAVAAPAPPEVARRRRRDRHADPRADVRARAPDRAAVLPVAQVGAGPDWRCSRQAARTNHFVLTPRPAAPRPRGTRPAHRHPTPR